MSPTVSVVIPAYNHAAFIGKAIESVLEQSFADLEIVITDDGSSDGTVDAIRAFADPRVNLEVFAENQGAVLALNSAIRRSQGAYICMLSSDDYFLPGKLARQVEFLNAHPKVAATFGLPSFIDERGEPLTRHATFNGDIFEAPVKLGLDAPAKWLRYFFFECNCLCHPTVMARRSVYDEIGLFDPHFANLPDFEMWVRMSLTHRIHVAADELTGMRILDDNRNMSAPSREAHVRTLLEFYQTLKHYRRLPRETLHTIFAPEIDAHAEWASLSPGELLAEVALTSRHACHRFFALDTALEETDAGQNYRRLYALAGSVDLFGLAEAAELQNLGERLAAARVEIERLNVALSEAQKQAAAATAPAAEEEAPGQEAPTATAPDKEAAPDAAPPASAEQSGELGVAQNVPDDLGDVFGAVGPEPPEERQA